VTAIALSRGWTPNVITVWSLVVGLAAAACFATGDRGGLVVGAVLLQVSLVIDCVDGEVARYTRRFSALGAWLDAVFDRVKELVVYAALAVGSLRHGDDVWVLAVAALALLVVRHTVDFGFAVRHGDLTYVEIVQRPLREGAPSTYTVATGVTATPARPTDEVTGMAWARRVVILPIGERWLVISVLAALSGARAVFAALLVLGLVAALYTTAGRVRRTLGNRAPLREAASAHLRELVDLEPAGEALLSGPLAGLVAGRAGWLLPALARLSEFGVVTLLVARGLLPGGPAYLLLAAIAYHHYDTVYRQRQIGHAASMTTRSLLLGTDGRLLAVLVIAALAQEQALPVLVLAAWMAVVTVVESVRSWTSWLRAGAQAVAEDGMVA
jgi:phosphatidylglycerophosphate synthase